MFAENRFVRNLLIAIPIKLKFILALMLAGDDSLAINVRCRGGSIVRCEKKNEGKPRIFKKN